MNDPTSLIVGRAIARARQRRGWSQPDLARRLGEHRRSNQISRWESGYGIGIAALLELVEQMPDLGGEIVKLIRRAQRANLAERRQP
jgi:transcriptional regulator with XRE-family HTH domain